MEPETRTYRTCIFIRRGRLRNRSGVTFGDARGQAGAMHDPISVAPYCVINDLR
jgi:hypothetical protein